MSASATSAAAAKKNEKARQDYLQHVLAEILKDEDNKYCADCEAKGPRWASWNLGIFLCIRCAGMHRNLGVHISRVRSVNLDTWNDDQVSILQQVGNRKARTVYEALLPENFRRPQTDYALEQFIRAKYEHKRYVDRSLNWETPRPRPIVEPTGEHGQSAKPKTAMVGQQGAGLILPPVSSPHQPQTQQQSVRSPSLSPPLAPKAQAKPSGDLFDLFDNNQNAANHDSTGLSSSFASVQITPPSGEKVPNPANHLPHSATQSALDELSFLSPSQPQANAHPQQHHQRSVSNYDLMSVLGGAQPPQQSGAPAAGLDDILSLYKTAPTPQNFGNNQFQMFNAASPQQQQQQQHHHRNFSDAALAPGAFAPPMQQPIAANFGAFGGFPPQMPMQQPFQQPAQPQQGFNHMGGGLNSNMDFFQGGFPQQSQAPKPAATPAPAAANPAAFEAIWD